MRINLKDFRQSHGLFQSDMAVLLGMNQSTVSRLELKGSVSLTYPQLQKLYERYGKENVDSFAEEASAIIDSNNPNTTKDNEIAENADKQRCFSDFSFVPLSRFVPFLFRLNVNFILNLIFARFFSHCKKIY